MDDWCLSAATACPWGRTLLTIPPQVDGGSAPDIDATSISNLEAVEIYRGGADTPAELGGLGASCGTIVLWTRRR